MNKKYFYLVIIFLIVSSCLALGRIAGNDFINFDDTIYITANNNIKSGINSESIKWAFSNFVIKNWHPLTWISHILDWSLFGANASGHHIVSLLLHIGSVIFLFLFLNKTTGNLWPSAFAAAFFALHPLRVESVAWASERKDVLSMFFGMASIYAYAFYAEGSKLSQYFICLILFTLSLMSKSMLLTLPFVFLLLDYWPLGRWQKDITAPFKYRSQIISRLVWEKVPFFFLIIISSIMTIIWAQLDVSPAILPFPERVFNAIISYVSYLRKIFLPIDLAVFYPFQYSFPLWQILASCFVLIGITIIIYSIKKMPFLSVGWFWYLGTLIPAIGLVPINAPMADRYTYLPSIGIAIIMSWGIHSLINDESIRKKILFPAAIAILAILTVLTWQQCGYWKNSFELFNHTVLVTKNNYMALNKRGVMYGESGQHQLSIEDFNTAININPNDYRGYHNRGIAYASLYQYQKALEDCNKTILLKPDYAEAYFNRGVAYAELGQYQRAVEDFSETIRLKPDLTEAYYNRGTAYFIQKNIKLGCKDAKRACELGNCKILEDAIGKKLCR